MAVEGREFAKSIEPLPITPTEEFQLTEYWQILLRRWKLVALCVTLSLILGAVYSLAAKPTFRSTVVLDVEREGGGSVEVGPSTTRGYDLEYLPTQKELIQSREVAERVVRKLNLTSNPDFMGSKKRNPLRPGTSAKPTAGSPAQDIAAAAIGVQRHTQVVTVRGTRLFELSYVAGSPKLAAEIANAIAAAYIEWSLESAFQVVGQTSDFLKTQTEQVRKELEAKEQQLLAYGRQKDIVSDPHASGTVKNLDALNADYASALADRVQKEAKYYQLRTARPDAVAETLSNGLVGSIRADQARLERDYAEKLNLYKPEWPAMLQMKAQIDKGRQNLEAAIQDTVSKARETARNDYMTALRREEGLKGVLRSQKSDVMANNADAVEYNNLKAQVDAKRTLLDGLLKKQSEAEVISRGNRERASNVRIVDTALPATSRDSPSYRKNAMASLFGGGMLGIGLAFLFSYLDRSLRTAEQVQQYLHLPTLGVIPALSTEGDGYGYRRLSRKKAPSDAEDASIELLPHQNSRSRVAESYRAFRAALLLSRAGGVKSFVITSSFPREGKTATSVNLAVVLAQLGKRVARRRGSPPSPDPRDSPGLQPRRSRFDPRRESSAGPGHIKNRRSEPFRRPVRSVISKPLGPARFRRDERFPRDGIGQFRLPGPRYASRGARCGRARPREPDGWGCDLCPGREDAARPGRSGPRPFAFEQRADPGRRPQQHLRPHSGL